MYLGDRIALTVRVRDVEDACVKVRDDLSESELLAGATSLSTTTTRTSLTVPVKAAPKMLMTRTGAIK
ncbi:MAG: hypothetical protein ACXVH6_05105 [Halobacteriota archaeon]